MKLAEALQLRSDVRKRIQQLRQRIAVSARHAEGRGILPSGGQRPPTSPYRKHVST
jgi:hypothetical protein